MPSSQGDRDVKNRFLDSVGEGRGGMIWEASIETCTLPYVKNRWPVQVNVWSRAPKASALEQPIGIGWGGKREGGSGWEEHMSACDRSMLMNGKKQHNTVKWLSSG